MLKHLKIRTKIISVVALLGLITMAGLVYVIAEFRRADAAYSAFIDHEALASMQSARASAVFTVRTGATAHAANSSAAARDLARRLHLER